MATRSASINLRCSDEEKAQFAQRAESYGMSLGEYARYSMLVAPAPGGTFFKQGATPPNSYRGDLPTYDQLAAQVQTFTSTIENLAGVDTNVAAALDQARAALGPREE